MKWLTKLAAFLPFNQGKPATALGVLAVLVLLFIGFATQCKGAESSYIQAGAGPTLVRGMAPVIDVSLVYPEAGPKDSVIEVGATFIGGSTHSDKFQRNNFAWRAAVVDGFGPVEVGLGVAYLQNVDAFNGSHTNFNLILGYRFRAIPLTLRLHHFSNGGTVSPNLGRDMLLVFWRFE